jgi:hypothetical protein
MGVEPWGRCLLPAPNLPISRRVTYQRSGDPYEHRRVVLFGTQTAVPPVLQHLFRTWNRVPESTTLTFCSLMYLPNHREVHIAMESVSAWT